MRVHRGKWKSYFQFRGLIIHKREDLKWTLMIEIVLDKHKLEGGAKIWWIMDGCKFWHFLNWEIEFISPPLESYLVLGLLLPVQLGQSDTVPILSLTSKTTGSFPFPLANFTCGIHVMNTTQWAQLHMGRQCGESMPREVNFPGSAFSWWLTKLDILFHLNILWSVCSSFCPFFPLGLSLSVLLCCWLPFAHMSFFSHTFYGKYFLPNQLKF